MALATTAPFAASADAEAVAKAFEELRPRALSVLPLTMSWPIHSELMRPVADAIAPMIASSARVTGFMTFLEWS